MSKKRLSMVVIALVACSGGNAGEGNDRPDASTAESGIHSGSPGGAGHGESDVEGSEHCAYADCSCIDRAVCEKRSDVVPSAPLTMQDTSTGGFGDCSTCASCSGGRNLYYTVTIPP